MKSNVFRASYSVLKTWASGDYERTIKGYFRLEDFSTAAMDEGRRYHNNWAAEVLKTNCMPKVFGGDKLNNPSVEIYKKVELSDWLELSGKIDLLDEPIIKDWKTGLRSSESYINDYQLGVYGVLCTLSKIYVTKGEIHHYNQHSLIPDVSYRWLTDQYLKDTLNWIETLSSEIHSYFLQNDLYTKYQHIRDARIIAATKSAYVTGGGDGSDSAHEAYLPDMDNFAEIDL